MELKRQDELPTTTIEFSSQGMENSTSLNGSKSNSTSLHFNQIYTESINSKNNSLTDDTIGTNDKIDEHGFLNETRGIYLKDLSNNSENRDQMRLN